jgi:hypothetical protein
MLPRSQYHDDFSVVPLTCFCRLRFQGRRLPACWTPRNLGEMLEGSVVHQRILEWVRSRGQCGRSQRGETRNPILVARPTFEPHQSSGSRSDGPRRTSPSAAECDDSSDGQKPPQPGRQQSTTGRNNRQLGLRPRPRPSRQASSCFTARHTLLSSTNTSTPSYSNGTTNDLRPASSSSTA